MPRRKAKKSNNIPKPELLKEFKPRTKNQYEYTRAIIESDVTFCIGPAGGGKTACCIGAAITGLISNKFDKIVITRPIVEASYKSIGALPGGIREKIDPYILPLYQELEGYLGKYKLESYIDNGKIVICPLELMRGLTFDNSFVILDEAQNAMFKQITMFVTRLGMNSKAVINGDLSQTDLPNHLMGGFEKYITLMRNIIGVSIVELDSSDIQRHPVVSRILEKVEGV